MLDRRSLFSSIVNVVKGGASQKLPFLPLLPGFDKDKQKQCLSCELAPCVQSCPEKIIIKNDQSVPVLNFEHRGCTFCNECALACPSDCFIAPPTINAVVSISLLKCLAWNKTICCSCADACNDKAIAFLGLFRPEIDPLKCTSCGFCVGVCPSGAIVIEEKRDK